MSHHEIEWEVVTAPPGSVFLCEIAELIDGGLPRRRNIVPPPLLARRFAGGSNGMIYLPEPCVYGATLLGALGRSSEKPGDLANERSFFPFALPLPSLLVEASKLSIRTIPEPTCIRWPGYTWPLAAGLFGEFMKGSLASQAAEGAHIPDEL